MHAPAAAAKVTIHTDPFSFGRKILPDLFFFFLFSLTPFYRKAIKLKEMAAATQAASKEGGLTKTNSKFKKML